MNECTGNNADNKLFIETLFLALENCWPYNPEVDVAFDKVFESFENLPDDNSAFYNAVKKYGYTEQLQGFQRGLSIGIKMMQETIEPRMSSITI